MSLVQHASVQTHPGFTETTTTVREYDDQGRVTRETVTVERVGSMTPAVRPRWDVLGAGMVTTRSSGTLVNT